VIILVVCSSIRFVRLPLLNTLRFIAVPTQLASFRSEFIHQKQRTTSVDGDVGSCILFQRTWPSIIVLLILHLSDWVSATHAFSRRPHPICITPAFKWLKRQICIDADVRCIWWALLATDERRWLVQLLALRLNLAAIGTTLHNLLLSGIITGNSALWAQSRPQRRWQHLARKEAPKFGLGDLNS